MMTGKSEGALGRLRAIHFSLFLTPAGGYIGFEKLLHPYCSQADSNEQNFCTLAEKS